MKRVLASPDSAQIGLAQSILEAAGIACEVRNDAVSQAMPGMPFIPELWVLRDEDYEVARRRVHRVGRRRQAGVTRRVRTQNAPVGCRCRLRRCAASSLLPAGRTSSDCDDAKVMPQYPGTSLGVSRS